MADTQFSIHLPQFEGPFDLLLFFIERDELSIQDIPIAKITDDFLGYIHQMNVLNIELASEFIFVAATLMRIKAKMLLPRPELDDEGNEIDLKADLIRKLTEYKQFKEICEELRVFEDLRMQGWSRGNIPADRQLISESDTMAESGQQLSISLNKLALTYRRVMLRFENRTNDVRHTVVQYPYSIEKQKEAIGQLLSINKKLDFQLILGRSENRVHFVYNFLAILEMLQQQLADIQLGLGYNNFWITPKADFTP
ncbi:MAG: segregation/condensation protein A [Mucilaginibacter polytrichastri]|nr:segregation/condensation protein A [Mucilaginibacter polytrichastri]